MQLIWTVHLFQWYLVSLCFLDCYRLSSCQYAMQLRSHLQKGVSASPGLFWGQGLGDTLPVGHEGPLGQPHIQGFSINLGKKGQKSSTKKTTYIETKSRSAQRGDLRKIYVDWELRAMKGCDRCLLPAHWTSRTVRVIINEWTTSSSLATMLKWTDERMSQPSMLFRMVS